MDRFIRDRLEDYLAGTLTAEETSKVEVYLTQHRSSAAELGAYKKSSLWFENLRAPDNTGPGNDFYVHVMQRVETQKKDPFWMFFIQPVFARRLALGGLMWLALLGGYVVNHDSLTTESGSIVAAGILSRPTPPEFDIRLGSDVHQNRDSMLAILLVRD
jgi:anti-sigma factor RsiW